ncbi:MAG: hypothetical protein AAGA66_00730 [Bacteroidota bacterium]
MKTYLLQFLLLVSPLIGMCQLFDGEEYKYNSEVIWGINKNTNGGLIGGLMLRISKSRGNDVYETYGLELSNVKHPSERRFVGIQGQGYIYGKSNYLYAVRFQYGREKLMFKKANQQGVQINVGGAVGPTLGLENPYYVLTPGGAYEAFSPAAHPSPETIAGPGRLFQGVGETNVVPGINGKGSVSFEFGTYRSNVAGVELGFMLEAYTRKVVIVPTQPNDAVFTSFYMTLFWGTRK